jgi:hypothetical protein
MLGNTGGAFDEGAIAGELLALARGGIQLADQGSR